VEIRLVPLLSIEEAQEGDGSSSDVVIIGSSQTYLMLKQFCCLMIKIESRKKK